MKYAFSYHSRQSRPLWKAVVYESLRLVLIGVVLVAVAGILFLAVSAGPIG